MRIARYGMVAALSLAAFTLAFAGALQAQSYPKNFAKKSSPRENQANPASQSVLAQAVWRLTLLRLRKRS